MIYTCFVSVKVAFETLFLCLPSVCQEFPDRCYQMKATALITIEPHNLAKAIASGFDFLRIVSLELYMGLKSGTQTHGKE